MSGLENNFRGPDPSDLRTCDWALGSGVSGLLGNLDRCGKLTDERLQFAGNDQNIVVVAVAVSIIRQY